MKGWNFPSIIALIAVIVSVLLVLRRIHTHKKEIFSCGGNCEHCAAACTSKKSQENREN